MQGAGHGVQIAPRFGPGQPYGCRIRHENRKNRPAKQSGKARKAELTAVSVRQWKTEPTKSVGSTFRWRKDGGSIGKWLGPQPFRRRRLLRETLVVVDRIPGASSLCGCRGRSIGCVPSGDGASLLLRLGGDRNVHHGVGRLRARRSGSPSAFRQAIYTNAAAATDSPA